ncbi:MAG: enoyl-CoA hydratase [Planctomycetes bacterium]|nr:enoyl-CoA hydratase [Planctomycetota bacterium]
MLLVESDSGVVRLTLNRPERRNALSEAMLSELGAALEGIAGDKSARVVVLGAAGNVFCSGHDLAEMVGRQDADYQALFSRCSRVMQQIRQLPQPVIARVQGLATAAGCQLVATCDLAVAVPEARFATPGVKIGLFCTTPMVPLVRAIAPKVAMEMLLTGIPITAERALAVGLINRVVPADQLDASIREITEAIVGSSAATLALGKRAFYDQLALDEPTAYERATCLMTENAVQYDAQEGISAFLKKRPPQWKSE